MRYFLPPIQSCDTSAHTSAIANFATDFTACACTLSPLAANSTHIRMLLTQRVKAILVCVCASVRYSLGSQEERTRARDACTRLANNLQWTRAHISPRAHFSSWKSSERALPLLPPSLANFVRFASRSSCFCCCRSLLSNFAATDI